MEFIVIRLGKDSIDDINKINSLIPSTFEPFVLHFKCKQVENSIQPGAFAFIYLGSDNNKGIQTEWKQGIKAFGVLEGIDGWINFQSECTLKIKVFSIFSTSLDQFDFLEKSPTLYKHFSQYPIIGVKSSRNNSVQKVNDGVRERTEAVLTSIASLQATFQADLEKHAPELVPLLSFKPENTDGTTSGLTKRDSMHTLNQILYGPPGTGKTHNSVNHALAIIYNRDVNELIAEQKENPVKRVEAKNQFDELLRKGQIQFVTFHQSYSYEDFVEGIKSFVNSEGQVEYRIQDGIFKKLCLEATKSSNKYVIIEGVKKELTKELFEEFYYDLSEALPDQAEKSSTVKLKTKEGYEFQLFKNSNNSIVVKAGEKQTPSSVSFNELEKVLFEDKAPVYKSYEAIIINKILDGKGYVNETSENEKKPYVLIIDEINRGNISKIFGELITLIEDSKRIGNPEELKVKLPYSGVNDKASFGVPQNLYIIGTMNSADRSIALIDTALRRRFTFIEYSADYSLLSNNVEGINIQELLKAINSRIEILLDKDHKIGHAYLINIKSKNQLCDAFRNKIVPLLEEYFYGDYEKIQLVFGDNPEFNKNKESRVITNNQSSDQRQLFGKEIDGFEEKIIYQVNDKISFQKYEDIQADFFTSIYTKSPKAE